MSRKWTPRKRVSLNETAIDAKKYARAYTLYRGELDHAEATQRVLRLLFACTLLWLPIH